MSCLDPMQRSVTASQKMNCIQMDPVITMASFFKSLWATVLFACTAVLLLQLLFLSQIISPSTMYWFYLVPVITEIHRFTSGTRSSCSSKHSRCISAIFRGQVFLIFLFPSHFVLFSLLSLSSYSPFSFSPLLCAHLISFSYLFPSHFAFFPPFSFLSLAVK